MTALQFTTNTGGGGDDVLGVRANFDAGADILFVDSLILGKGGNDSLGSTLLPLGLGDQLFSWGITLDGGSGDDSLNGYNKTDVLIGGAGRDSLAGVSGSSLSGGDGIDTLGHQVNPDTFTGNFKIDYAAQAAAVSVLADGTRISGFEKFNIIGGKGRDGLNLSGDANANGSSFFSGEGSDRLTIDSLTRGQIVFNGGGGSDRLIADLAAATARVTVDGSFGASGLVGPGVEILCVGVDAYTVTTGSAADRLTGGDGLDVMNGGAGRDVFRSSLGADTVTGGLGNDRFAFNEIGGGADTITDFHNTKGDNDFLTFELADAGALGADLLGLGLLQAVHFQASSAATAQTADARFIYDTDDGKLRFDADGNGAAAAKLIGTLAGAPVIAADDISIVVV